MQINAKTKWINEKAEVAFGRYQADGAVAIRLVSPEGEPLATATVCLVEYGFTPPAAYVVIKNYSENEGMLDCLVAEGVVKAPTEVIVAGPYGTPFPVCELTDAAVTAMQEAA